MARGDQIYSMRHLAGISGVYEHHGIDMGDGTVIHYSKAGDRPEIARTSRASFARGGPIYHCDQPVSYIPEVIVRRAESRLGESAYDLFFNNCEHFANWCTTGRNESRQLSNFGLRLDFLQQPELRQIAERTVLERSPEQAIFLFRQALGDIATAYDVIRQQQQVAQQEAQSWHRTAQAALQRQREDLARAALYRKVQAKNRADQLTQQLQELVEMRLTLERNQARISS